MGTREIRVSYRSLDGYSKSRSYKTLEGARRFAAKWVGETPEYGAVGGYAVSADGIGKVTWEGCTFEELFPGSDGPADWAREDRERDCEERFTAACLYDTPYTREDEMRNEFNASSDDNSERYAAELADLELFNASEDYANRMEAEEARNAPALPSFEARVEAEDARDETNDSNLPF